MSGTEITAFDTKSPAIHGVSAQTGAFHTYLPIAKLLDNDGLGPELDIKLVYSPGARFSVFGNWALNLSSATASSQNPNLFNLNLSNGESWKLSGKKLFTPNIYSRDNNDIVHKDGTVESFDSFFDIIIGKGKIKDIKNLNSEAIPFVNLLTKKTSSSGRSITLSWESFNHEYETNGIKRVIILPRLESVSNEKKQLLLRIEYTEENSQQKIIFHVHPGTANQYSVTIKLDDRVPLEKRKYLNSHNLTHSTINIFPWNGLTVGSTTRSDRIGTTEFSYTHDTHEIDRHTPPPSPTYDSTFPISSIINTITHPSGVLEEIQYDNKKVSSHTISINKQTISKQNYNHSNVVYGYYSTTIDEEISGSHSVHHFDASKNQQTKEVVTLGGCKKTIEVSRAVIFSEMDTTSLPAKEIKPGKMEVITTTTYENPGKQTRSEQVRVTLDLLGNIIAKTENGVTTEWTYYQGAPRESILVKKETFNASPSVTVAAGWIGDYLNPIGWGFHAFGNAGLTWGTREVRTVTRFPFVTDTGKKTFNLPVDIICPGDPNYFRVYVESEKVYTLEGGKRTDLRWTFFGYGKLPVQGAVVNGPAVRPTIKLTIYNPIADASGKLVSGANDAMTVEETQYITDVKDAHHGRVKSTSQKILDTSGSTVAGSIVTTEFVYNLEHGELTTTASISAGDTPAVTQKQTILTLTGQLLTTTDSQGNKTKYEYDQRGRTTRQANYGNDDAPYATTNLSYVDSTTQDSTVTRTSAIGEQSREVFDSLGRLTQTQRLHSDGNTWLTLGKTVYNSLGRESAITEYDYHPDGSQFLSRTRNLEYDDWGAVSKIKWVGGVTQGFEYDPVSRQQTQWTTYGTHQSGSVSTVFDEQTGTRRHETSIFTNGQLQRSYTAIYDALGKLTEESSSFAPKRQYTYDKFGRLTRITAANEITTNDYPTHTLSATASAARLENGKESCELGSRTLDSLGRVTKTTVGGRTTNFTYTGSSDWGKSDSKPNSDIQQGIPVTLAAAYESKLNQVTETTTGGIETGSNWETSTARYTCSLRGVVLSETDAFGNTTTFNYDAQGRLSSTSSATAKVDFSYDSAGRLTTETLENLIDKRSMVTNFTYDDKDRETQRKFEAEGFNTLTIVQDYNNSSQIASMTLYEASTLLRKETFTYNDKGQLASYTCEGPRKPVTPEGLILDSQTFTYDLAGNLKQCNNTSNGGTFQDRYQYDGTDRTQLVSVTRGKPDKVDRACTFSYDDQGRLSNNDDVQLQYNDLGRLGGLKFPKSKRLYNYSYNNLRQLVGCTGNDYYELFYYQGDSQYARKGGLQTNGQRIYRTTVLLNQSAACVLQQNTQKIHDETKTVSHSFEIKDIKGTVIASHNLLDNSSTIFAYTPFGYRPYDWAHHSWIGFNGQPIDRVTGCYHLGNGERVYDPDYQRFQTRDKFSPFGKGGANNRSYCHNDPVNYSDPSGQAEIVHQYTVVTHGPAIQDPIVQAVLFGSVGILLAPFTGGASIGWTTAAVGIAIVSAGFGIASAALQDSDPKLATAFGWASLGTGFASAGAGALGAKVAARASFRLAQSNLPASQRVAQGTIYRRGNLPAGDSTTGNVNAMLEGKPVNSTYELYSGGLDSRILYIDAHGTAMASEHVLSPLSAEFQFRSAPGVKAADVGTNWETRVLGRTAYRHPPGATDIPNYILDEFTVAEHIKIGSLPSNYQPILKELAKQLNADILRPTSKVLLSDLMTEVTRQGYHYDRIVGNFCRGTMAYDTPPLVQSIRRAIGAW
ncbi:hypothetical protein KRR23_27710 [Pseudomonas sp. CVAP|uniref:RHS repeat domain-containing protein n=1 Tax=Pseudomonas sp. CVAP\|nr:RHS repeat-associated core domain-containing protein [Pseudomonas sp. CVAP\